MKKLTKAIVTATTLVTMSLTVSACDFQPNWFAAGQWNYTHQNYDKALPQLLWAAQLGNPSAQYAVGYMYFNGMGTPQDDTLAYHWFTQAAKHGDPRAEIALHQMQSLSVASHHHHHAHKQHMHHIKPAMHQHKQTHITKAPRLPKPQTSKQLPTLPAPIKTK